MVRMLLGSRLPGLAPHLLADVADTLPFVWLRRTYRPELRRHLADQLLVGPLDLDDRIVVDRDLDAFGCLVLHRMGITDDQVDSVWLCLGLVAHALDLEAFTEALGDSLDHVLHQRAGQAVKRLVPLFITRPGDGKLI